MNNELNDLWKSVLAEVEIEVSKAIFLTLFRQTALVSFEENKVTIAAPSSMIIDLLKRRYYQVIKKSLDKISEKSVEIVFVPKTILPVIKDERVGPLFAQTEKEPSKPQRVRAEYVFENLAVSSSNQLAYVSAKTVANKIGTAYNPLFIYGSVGVGKTHLMQAIANEVFKNDPTKKILYLTSEEFTNEVVEAIRTNSTGGMKKRFRGLDLLIIDDIQFVAGKERVQEELFHTFNILVDSGAQIVLSSDKPPSEIKKVEKRLLSRFSGGLTVDIEPADFELRTAILLIKAKKHGFSLPIEQAKKIAEKDRDGRALEGVLLRLITEAEEKGEALSDQEVIDVVDKKRGQEAPLHPDDIVNSVCSFYKVKQTLLKGAKRDASLVRARQVAMFLLKKEAGLTLTEIGNILGGRDHTTIMHGVEKISSLLEKKLLSEDILGITKPAR
jgi:chromosomal replication initiator protein